MCIVLLHYCRMDSHCKHTEGEIGFDTVSLPQKPNSSDVPTTWAPLGHAQAWKAELNAGLQKVQRMPPLMNWMSCWMDLCMMHCMMCVKVRICQTHGQLLCMPLSSLSLRGSQRNCLLQAPETTGGWRRLGPLRGLLLGRREVYRWNGLAIPPPPKYVARNPKSILQEEDFVDQRVEEYLQAGVIRRTHPDDVICSMPIKVVSSGAAGKKRHLGWVLCKRVSPLPLIFL